jgi:hypothetical protein
MVDSAASDGMKPTLIPFGNFWIAIYDSSRLY